MVSWAVCEVSRTSMFLKLGLASDGAVVPWALLLKPFAERPDTRCGSSYTVEIRSLEIWLDARKAPARRRRARARFVADLEAGRRSFGFLKHPLLPYQVEGALHLAFGERVLLADDMGLGKTVQAIAACALLRELARSRAGAGGLARVAEVRVGGADRQVLRPPLDHRARRLAESATRLTAGSLPTTRRCSMPGVASSMVSIASTMAAVSPRGHGRRRRTACPGRLRMAQQVENRQCGRRGILIVPVSVLRSSTARSDAPRAMLRRLPTDGAGRGRRTVGQRPGRA